MKVLIYGGNGWIGNQVIELLRDHEVIKGCARAENIKELEKEIETHNPTHIMSFIGRTHGMVGDKLYTTIDYLEQKGKIRENVRDNLYSPIVLATLASRHKIHFTYMGTGCIFEYDETHPFGLSNNGFTEGDTPNFFGSGYSVVKGYTDKLMHMYEDSVLNVRIRMPITTDYNSRNFITKIINYEKICSVPNSMSVLPELLPLLIDMAEKKVTGTVNLTNPGLISHNEILTMYKEIVDPDFTWVNFTVEEQDKILAAGRSNNYLDTGKLQTLYPKVLDIKTAVSKCLESMAKLRSNEK
jgi:3,5-epimerase/4-reductase